MHLSLPLLFIAENTKSSEPSEGRIYFGPKQKRVGDSVGRDSWTWQGWVMTGGAQNFLCFAGGRGRCGLTEVLSLKHSQMRGNHCMLLSLGRRSTSWGTAGFREFQAWWAWRGEPHHEQWRGDYESVGCGSCRHTYVNLSVAVGPAGHSSQQTYSNFLKGENKPLYWNSTYILDL